MAEAYKTARNHKMNKNLKRRIITMKRKLSLVLAVALLCGTFGILAAFTSSAAEYTAEINCKSAILMEASTGKILYEKNADEALPPASVTKIMTLLLTMESIDSGKIKPDEKVTTSERAASMGGSQVYLKVGEELTVEELLKCVVICSANDATVALAEHIAGSEEAFVNMMNQKAAELGMKNTHFENTNGLDDTVKNHVTSARDIALMSQALISHEKILTYSSTWMDSIRDGAFILTNTNRLVRFYPGANGLKTGSTSKAGFCISATAKRDNMQLICVIMGAPTRDVRNDIARTLLDFGFANYGVYTYDGGDCGTLPVTGGICDSVSLTADPFSAILEKGAISGVTTELVLPETLAAPLKAGDVVGHVIYKKGDEKIGESDITVKADVEKITFFSYFMRLLKQFVGLSEIDAE